MEIIASTSPLAHPAVLISFYFSAFSPESTEQKIVQKSQEEDHDNFGSEQDCVEVIEIPRFIIGVHLYSVFEIGRKKDVSTFILSYLKNILGTGIQFE